MKIYDYNGCKNNAAPEFTRLGAGISLSQEQLAARLQVAGVNIERDSISRIEIGTRFVADYELAALSTILSVTPEYLLFGE